MKLIWSEESWDDYLYWQETDKRIVKKINELIKDTRRTLDLPLYFQTSVIT
ncbi:hypothetical protein CBL31_26540 [Shigella flexneri]|nr:hypothetical protein CBL31_26540 [Shigella flexneri]